MNILVTGGAGYVGSVTVEVLHREGHKVVVIDDLREGHRSAVDPVIPLYTHDIADREKTEAVLREEKIEAAVHMAGETLVTKSMTQPEDYFLNNVQNGLALLEAMRVCDVKRIVFSSTAALFGNPIEVPITEQHPTQPINAYGRSKLIFEEMLHWYGVAHGLKHVCVRYFNAAGASELHGEHHRVETHLIPIVLQVALGQRDRVSIFGTDFDTRDGSCIRDYVHIEDLAYAHLRALERVDDIGSQKFNLGNGCGFSVKEVIDTSRKITGHPIPATDDPRRAGDPGTLVASSKKANELLGWTPKYPAIEDIIQSAWNWHQKFPDGYPD